MNNLFPILDNRLLDDGTASIKLAFAWPPAILSIGACEQRRDCCSVVAFPSIRLHSCVDYETEAGLRSSEARKA